MSERFANLTEVSTNQQKFRLVRFADFKLVPNCSGRVGANLAAQRRTPDPPLSLTFDHLIVTLLVTRTKHKTLVCLCTSSNVEYSLYYFSIQKEFSRDPKVATKRNINLYVL